MKFTNMIAAAVILGMASVSTASAATNYGFELWASGVGKKGTVGSFRLVNTGDAKITGMTLGVGNKKFKFRGSGNKLSLSDSMLSDFGTSKFKVRTAKDKNNKSKAFYKVLFNNGKKANGYVAVDFLVEGVSKTVMVDLDDVRKKYFRNKKHKAKQMLAFGPLTEAQVAVDQDEIVETVLPSVVPLPAALPLMLGGLFGLGMVGRRRKA